MRDTTLFIKNISLNSLDNSAFKKKEQNNVENNAHLPRIVDCISDYCINKSLNIHIGDGAYTGREDHVYRSIRQAEFLRTFNCPG
jgi:hypothetical protein